MGSISLINRYMAKGSPILLDDGRTGTIVRIDTAYPGHSVTVSVDLGAGDGPGVAQVKACAIVGPAPDAVA